MNLAPANSDMRASDQARFVAALFDPALVTPELKSWNGSDPAQRFGVYRNNVTVALVDALADTFPVVQAMVGEPFFRAMARVSLKQDLPDTPVLAYFGKRFPDFIAAFPPAAGLPYLADLARLEYARVEAFHAADRVALNPTELSPLLTDARGLVQLKFDLHPSLRLVASTHPIVDLWAAHAAEGDLGQVDLSCAQSALVLRHDLEVEVFALGEQDAAFLAALLAGHTLGEALQRSGGSDFDVSPVLALLLRTQSVCGANFANQDPS